MDQKLVRPRTLEEGEAYLWSDSRKERRVRFVAYTSCPAFVVVQDQAGSRRCLRDELFALRDGSNAGRKEKTGSDQ